MSSNGSWDDGFEGSWKAFRHALTARLHGLGAEETLTLDVMVDEDAELASAPYVMITRDAAEGRIRAEVSGNLWLADDHRMDVEQELLLNEIGWVPPVTDAPELDPAEANFTADAAPEDVDWLAVMAVRALREVFGVVHPAFVLVDGEEPDCQAGVTADDPEAELARPMSREQLVDLVDAALTPVFGHVPTKDEDGDIPVVTGQSVVFVQVHPSLPCVDLYVEVVLDVAEIARALVEVNILNRKATGPVYVLVGDRVIARQRVSADPFVPEHLREALGAALVQVDEIAGDIIERVGGRAFAAELPPKPRRTERPSSRTWIQTLTHLEDDQPGSVSDVLAAHIFHMNQKAILDQINRQRRSGRADLADLLRRALRVVVEHQSRELADQ